MGYTQTKLEELEERVEALEQAGIQLNYVVGEIPTGVIDGVNATFTMTHKFTDDSVEVFLDGLRQEPFLYDEVNNQQIIFHEAPPIDDGDTDRKIVVNYFKLIED